MSSSADTPELRPRELADLSALADGTLDPARREEVQSRVSASPELRALYARERQVVELLQAARERDRAPAALRARIDAQRPPARTRVRPRAVYGATTVAALAAVVLALVLLAPGGTPGAPSLSQAAALAVRGPVTGAPPPDPSAPSVKLAENIQDLYFPNWAPRFGWRAIGKRTDQINGRKVVTVYYASHGKRLAYSIVSSPPLKAPAAAATWLQGTELRTLTLGKRLVVTWRRGGNTCVLSGVGVTGHELRMLAAWKVPGEDR